MSGKAKLRGYNSKNGRRDNNGLFSPDQCRVDQTKKEDL